MCSWIGFGGFRRTVAVAAVVVAVAGCSSNGGTESSDGPPSVETVPGGEISFFDLMQEGGHSCEDLSGDVTTSSQGQVPPPVPQPGLDLLKAELALDGEDLVGTFTTDAPVNLDQDPELVVSFGFIGDLDTFELRTDRVEGGWVLEVHRPGSADSVMELPSATVVVDGAQATFRAPLSQLPIIQPNTAVGYGITGDLIDEDGNLIDGDGEPLEEGEDERHAFDDCLFS